MSIKRLLNRLAGLVFFAFTAAFAPPGALAGDPAIYDYEIVNAYPHDPNAFTQGLFFHDGRLYESTGLKGRSSIRKVDLVSGEVLQQTDLPASLFGEGVTIWNDRIVQLTWRSQVGFVYDIETFARRRKFTYAGEGWGLTQDGERLIMSDGSAALRFLDPGNFREAGRVTVMHQGKPVGLLNELEYVNGAVLANIWHSDVIVRIDPESGAVTGIVDLRSLRERLGPDQNAEVLNGIAYDEKTGRLFVTGKFWPALFEIRLIERRPPDSPSAQ